MTSTWTSGAAGLGEYADVNGLRMYYEIHGTGRPLILLHGGLGSGEMFGPLLPALADHHQVIVPDLQGHGRTADIDRPLSTLLMADDIAALGAILGLDRPDVVGYSLGGGVAIQTALHHPEAIRRVVAFSANIRRSAIYPEMLGQQDQVNAAAAEFMKDTPMYELYARVAPRPEDFPTLLDKIGASMAQDFDVSEEIRGIQVPLLFGCANSDMFPASHAVEVWGLLGGGQHDGGWQSEGRPAGGHALVILPGLTHYNVCTSPLTARATLDFLDAPSADQRADPGGLLHGTRTAGNAGQHDRPRR